MAKHTISVPSTIWERIKNQEQRFMIDVNDNAYQKGDTLIIKNAPTYGAPTLLAANIDYVLSGWGLKNGHVVLSLKNIKWAVANEAPSIRDW